MIFDFLIRKFFKKDGPAPEASPKDEPYSWPVACRTWAIGGGKGGVGKSFIASSLACALAQSGKRVILVDADLGGANLHTMFGIRVPQRTLNDFIAEKVRTMPEVLLPTSIPTLSLICGASDIMEHANPGYAQRKRLLAGLKELVADFVLIDVGAGSSYSNLDFFNAAELGIIVTCPTPTAIQNAYSFLKMALHRRIIGLFAGSELKGRVSALLEGDDSVPNIEGFISALRDIDAGAADKVRGSIDENRYRLIVNMATGAEGDKIAAAMAVTAQKHLSVKLPSLGALAKSPEIDKSIRKMEPLMLTDTSDIAEALKRITTNAVEGRATLSLSHEGEHTHVTIKTSEGSSKLQSGLNEDIIHDGLTLHVQTEDLGAEKRKIQTLVYSGGRILFSRATDYGEIKAEGDFGKAVIDKLMWQHAAIIAGIKAGKLKGKTDKI